MSDAKGALVILGALPPAKVLLGDKGYDADWFRKALCQRRSKNGPRGGAKLGHFGFERDVGDGRRPVSRALHVAGG